MFPRSSGTVSAAAVYFSATAVLLAGLLSGCSPGETSEIAQMQSVTVRVAPVVSDPTAEPLRFAGTVQPRQRAVLTFQVNGTLQERPVKLGQAVAKDQLLAKLYNPQLEPARDSARAKLRELQAQAKQSARELERAEKLHQKGVQSVQVVEQARAAEETLEASVATARAAVAEAEQMAAETELRAPFAGRIEALSVEAGEFISPGQPVISLAGADAMEVAIRVPAYLLADLQTGDDLPVWLVREPGAGSAQGTVPAIVPASVAEIAQSGGRVGSLQTVLVHLEDPPPQIPVAVSQDSAGAVAESLPTAPLSAVPVAGTAVEVGIPGHKAPSLSVPMLAVMRSRDGAAVFRVRDGKAERVPVTIVQLLGEDVLVSSNALGPDDSVVFAGLTRLADGDAVEILP